MDSAPLDLIRSALADVEAWVVGGTVRDRLLGHPTGDVDIVVAGHPGDAVRAVRDAAGGGAAFELSDRFGAWRYVSRDRTWQVDAVAVRDGDLRADLAARDFTVNAMAEPLAGGTPVDPFGGLADLECHELRAVSPRAFADDPLRCLRAVRLEAELDLTVVPDTAAMIPAHASGLERVAPERIFAELRRIVGSPRDPVAALERLSAFGITAVVVPELEALRGVEQSVYHHRDVHDHTLEVLAAVVRIGDDPAAVGLPRHADALRALLAEPLADGVTRGDGMRFAALLHDIAKPETARRRLDGRGYGFPGHHEQGAVTVRRILRRLRASERLVEYVAALTEHHLRLGFLVHGGPLDARAVHRYLAATAPVSADVTAFTVADRLATRGRKADQAITAHAALADEMLGYAFERRAAPRPTPLIRGDELAAALGIDPGPRLGELLAQLEEDRYAGVVETREEAIERARKLI